MPLAADIEKTEAPKAKAPRMEVPRVETPVEPETPEKSGAARWIVLMVVLAAAAGGAYWWTHAQGFEATDDAQVEGHLDSISSRISGTVTYINPKVENNQTVEAGALLLELDPRDYQAELEHAKANLDVMNAEAGSAQVNVPIVSATAFSQLRAAEAAKAQAEAGVETERANLMAAQHRLQQDQAIAERAERDRVRYQTLVDKHEISRSEYDSRATEAAAAQQAVEADRAAISAGEQRIEQSHSVVLQRQASIDAGLTAPQQVTQARSRFASAFGQTERARADLHTAQLNLEYTKIYAPVSGVIGRKTVELGHRIQPGQGLMVIVPRDDIWITANFKETQLKKIRPGQKVDVHVDTFGRKFTGTVESMPGAAGPLFSLFPPENSSGNYVKVVQRFPVRIRFDKGQDADHLLTPGMSVEPTITVR